MLLYFSLFLSLDSMAFLCRSPSEQQRRLVFEDVTEVFSNEMKDLRSISKCRESCFDQHYCPENPSETNVSFLLQTLRWSASTRRNDWRQGVRWESVAVKALSSSLSTNSQSICSSIFWWVSNRIIFHHFSLRSESEKKTSTISNTISLMTKPFFYSRTFRFRPRESERVWNVLGEESEAGDVYSQDIWFEPLL